MSRIGIGYEIGRFTGVCAATGEVLEPGAACVATLAEAIHEDGSPAEGFVRQDFTPAAWEAGHRPERLFSFWRTAVPHPDAPKRLAVDEGVLIDLLTRLEGDERPTRLAFRFVVALILLRKRQLRQIGRERVTMALPRRIDGDIASSARPESDSDAPEHAAAAAAITDGPMGDSEVAASGESVESPVGESAGESAGGRFERGEPEVYDVWLLLPRGAAEGEEPLRVIDPRLGPDDVASIAEQLGEVLQSDL